MRRLSLSCLAISLIVGCSSVETGEYKDKRFAVKGAVTLDGRPLENGTIAFVSTAEGQRPAGGPIVNGMYELTEGQGPNAGKYRVEIRSQKPTGKKVKDSDTGAMMDVMTEALPPRYHDKSILTATIEDGKTEYPFELVAK